MDYIGLDIGGTSIKAGLVDQSGHILESQRAPTIIHDLNGFLSNLTELIRDFQKSVKIAAVGMGVPGLRNCKTHVIETSPNIPCLLNVNLEDLVADQVHLPVISENDANAGAYAEFVCGAGAGTRQMVYLTLGTGLGSGLILNGRLFTGASGYAGEFGHTVINSSGRLCGCGNRGCLETFVSGTGIVRTAAEKGMPGSLTAEIVYEAATRGDATALEVFRETGIYLGIACANLINLLNLEVIVVGGGVMAAGEMLLEPARTAAARHAFPSSFRDCQIVQSKLWPDAGVIGAAMLARDLK
ncbi:MAG TPA: ROK family protein [Terriglobia bacterium]|nr:ROK family protein [Terriglobia bacterium]